MPHLGPGSAPVLNEEPPTMLMACMLICDQGRQPTYGGIRVDLAACPDVYRREFWSVDRLHPRSSDAAGWLSSSPRLINETGLSFAAPSPTPTVLPATRGQNVRWVLIEGTPWLGRRARDLGPWAARTLVTQARQVCGVEIRDQGCGTPRPTMTWHTRRSGTHDERPGMTTRTTPGPARRAGRTARGAPSRPARNARCLPRRAPTPPPRALPPPHAAPRPARSRTRGRWRPRP